MGSYRSITGYSIARYGHRRRARIVNALVRTIQQTSSRPKVQQASPRPNVHRASPLVSSVGRFRLVTGSGYGRHEYIGAAATRKINEIIRAAQASPLVSSVGRFRVVTGSGYGRHEYTGAEATRKINEIIRAAQASSRLSGTKASARVTAKRKGSQNPAKNIIDDIYNKAFELHRRRAHQWAEETVAEFKNLLNSFADTGNLRDSIKILEETYDKSSGEIHVRVGVSEKDILPPPEWMRSPKYGLRNPDKMHYGERKMPNYDYSPFVIGSHAPHSGVAIGVLTRVPGGELIRTPQLSKEFGTRVQTTKDNELQYALSKISRKNAKKYFEKGTL